MYQALLISVRSPSRSLPPSSTPLTAAKSGMRRLLRGRTFWVGPQSSDRCSRPSGAQIATTLLNSSTQSAESVMSPGLSSSHAWKRLLTNQPSKTALPSGSMAIAPPTLTTVSCSRVMIAIQSSATSNHAATFRLIETTFIPADD